ncbi:MAG: sigma-70 family RNA polymerase sigma factor [Planctomycetes bacterium]|nr:sigma-70 family RNA polymerase sigma factor [Planctomycetota bacterium]
MPTLYTRTSGSGHGSGVFPRTRWSLVARVVNPGSRVGTGTRHEAYAELVTAYWRPVYRALRVKHREKREASEDLTQAFFLHLIEKRVLERFVADPEAGRFRSLLRSLLDRFVLTAQRDAKRLKRGGDRTHVPLDPAEIEAIESRIKVDPPGDPFDAEFRAAVIDLALRDLANESRSALARRRLEVFLAYEVEPQLGPTTGDRPTYSELAELLDLKPHDVKNDLVAARRRFAELVMERIREEVHSEEEAREELRALFGITPP